MFSDWIDGNQGDQYRKNKRISYAHEGHYDLQKRYSFVIWYYFLFFIHRKQPFPYASQESIRKENRKNRA
jgi:hypothetical protein